MSKLLDYVLATQLSTSFAWMFAIVAHLVDKYANENWQFATYVSLAITVLFMVAPYAFLTNEENQRETLTNR